MILDPLLEERAVDLGVTLRLGPGYEAAPDGAAATDPQVPVGEHDPFCVAYTSGTTGAPKGVLISHRSRCLTFSCTALEWGLGPGRRTVAPMYHGAGFAFAYASVFTGGTVSMLRAWDPGALLAMVARDRLQSVFLVPTHAVGLRELGLAGHDLSSLDTLYFNAAALPVALKEWVLESFPGAGVHELYGSTEAGVISNLRPADARHKAGSVGHPWFMTEIRVVAETEIDWIIRSDGELINWYTTEDWIKWGGTAENYHTHEAPVISTMPVRSRSRAPGPATACDPARHGTALPGQDDHGECRAVGGDGQVQAGPEPVQPDLVQPGIGTVVLVAVLPQPRVVGERAEVLQGPGERAGLVEVVGGAFVVLGRGERTVGADTDDERGDGDGPGGEVLLDDEPAQPGGDDQQVVGQHRALGLGLPQLLALLVPVGQHGVRGLAHASSSSGCCVDR